MEDSASLIADESAATGQHTMLHLKSESNARWLRQVDDHLDEILVDHAHCERKAASTAMNLINAYTEHRQLCHEMKRIVEEELEHFEMVLELLDQREIPFRRLASGPYGRELNRLIVSQEPQRAVDRLLVASLIEARSCERFSMLAKHVADSDRQLADFYSGLFESEARHHTTYVRLAEDFADRREVRERLDQLSAQESEIIATGCDLPRMHS
jgi:tRNA-(ms[2]io[6]A)-hydroxylase